MGAYMDYPEVVDEFNTLDLICGGASIARFGDGEFNLARGGNCVSQIGDMVIREELLGLLHHNGKECLIGIPRLDPRGPKDGNWRKLAEKYAPLLAPKKTYYSAFITRPDSAPWIATEEYFDKVESLWRDKDIAMVYGSERSLSRGFYAMKSAKSVEVIPAPYRDAYKEINQLEKRIAETGIKTVLLMVGPTATCLAPRLAARGFHAIDLGHIGMWWRAHRNEKLKRHLRLAA